MESHANIFPIHVAAESQVEAPKGLAERAKLELRRAWQIARDVLRGYLMGQPPDESRPRKGCC